MVKSRSRIAGEKYAKGHCVLARYAYVNGVKDEHEMDVDVIVIVTGFAHVAHEVAVE